MSPDPIAALRVLAEMYPAGTPVPVLRELLLELLEGSAGPVQTSARPADLTVADLCTRFHRKPSAVRAWLERGDFPGAYKLKGRDWRVPAAALEAFEATQRNPERGQRTVGEGGELGAWRRLRV